MKQRISYFVVGLFVGLIVGFIVTNHLNRPEFAPGRKTAGNPPIAPGAQEPGGQDPHGGALTDEQMATAKERVDADPQNYQNQLMFAEALYKMRRQPEEAVVYYERAHKLKPDALEPVMGLANSYFDMAEMKDHDAATFDKAASWYEKALELDPKNVNARTDLGLTYFYRDPPDVDRAISNYKKSLEVQPDHEITLGNYAVALMTKGDVAGAEQMLARLEKAKPDSQMLPQLRANLDRVRRGEKIPTH